jgi:hypothetical protein
MGERKGWGRAVEGQVTVASQIAYGSRRLHLYVKRHRSVRQPSAAQAEAGQDAPIPRYTGRRAGQEAQSKRFARLSYLSVRGRRLFNLSQQE